MFLWFFMVFRVFLEEGVFWEERRERRVSCLCVCVCFLFLGFSCFFLGFSVFLGFLWEEGGGEDFGREPDFSSLFGRPGMMDRIGFGKQTKRKNNCNSNRKKEQQKHEKTFL